MYFATIKKIRGWRGRQKGIWILYIPWVLQLRSESLELAESVVTETKCFLLLEKINTWM